MTFEEIAEELMEKAKQDDIKSLKEIAKKKIPELYPSLIDHPTLLQALRDERALFIKSMENYKWPSLGPDKEKENDVLHFIIFLRSLTKIPSIPTEQWDDERCCSPKVLAKHFNVPVSPLPSVSE